ncbi:MAG: hypothetical protein IH991_14700 [Planctomycetes bacterium]|nr:hypothetical protein [Planctomycetota bacterium]
MNQHVIRKAAILVDTLDAESADALLDQMSAEQSAQVRAAVVDLDHVNEAERRRVIDEFKTGIPPHARHADSGIELDDSLARKIAESRYESQQRPADSDSDETPPFRFLHQAATDTVTKFLRNEQPQTIAVVISHLPPPRAADVIAQLPGELQADVLQRVIQLGELDDDIIREVELEIEQVLVKQQRTTERQSVGLAAATAILKAADQRDREDMLANLARCDAELAECLSDEVGDSILRKPVPNPTNDDEGGKAMPVEFPGSQSPSQPIVEFRFDDLAALDDQSLAAVFQAADPNVSLLALAGADNAIVKRIAKQLPNRDARHLRKAIEQIGPVQLRDIENAKQQLAQLAGSLAGNTKPTMRRFAAAA